MKFKIKTVTRTEFNVSDPLEPAMRINNQEDADQYLKQYEELIRYEQEQYPETVHNKAPIEVARHNLGYYAGYYGNEVRERVEKLFNCEHPIFGKISEKGPPSFEEALMLGQKLGVRLRSKKSISERHYHI